MPRATTNYDTRAAEALGVVAWTYALAMSRGDTTAASGVLVAFQRAYGRYRQNLVASYAPAQQDAVNQALPRRLAVTGGYDSATQTALKSSLASAFGSELSSLALSLPTSAGEVGAWAAEVQPAIATDSVVARQAEHFLGNDPAVLPQVIEWWLNAEVEGDVGPTPSIDVGFPYQPEPSKPAPDLPAELVTARAPGQGGRWVAALFLAAIGVGLAGAGYTYLRRRR